MSNEKMSILRMLDEGKITADEASRLLESIDAGTKPKPAPTPTPSSYKAEDTISRPGSNTQYPNSRPAIGSSEWTANLGKKIEVFAKDLEPKIQKLTATVAEKTADIADKVSTSIPQSFERPTSPPRPTRAAPPSPAPRAAAPRAAAPSTARPGQIERSFELYVSSDQPNELKLKSMKGDIFIKGYNGDKISLKVQYRPKTGSARMDFIRLGCIYQMDYEPEDIQELYMEAYVPGNLFNRIRAEAYGGKITLNALSAEYIETFSENAQVDIRELSAEHIRIDNANGAVVINNIAGANMVVDTIGGSIEATQIDVSQLKMETASGAVTMTIPGFYNYNTYHWVVRTSNSKMRVNLPVTTDTGYDIKAYTSLSDVSVGLSGLIYSKNDRNFIEAKTAGFDTAHKKVRLEMDTSNAPLMING